MVRIVLIFILTVLQALFGVPDFLRDTEHYWLRAISYSFFHANCWHLAVNCLAAWCIFGTSRKPLKMILVAFLIAVLVYPVSMRPVIGFSNILYAVQGLCTPPFKSKWWRRKEVAVFFVVTLVLAFVPQFSATTHIAAFVLGMAGASFERYWSKITKDARRYYR